MTNALNKMGWLLAALVSIAALAALTGLVAAGPLDPPGPPTTGTMKTLQEVEPRTPISSLPYTISSSGSYYLTGNLTNLIFGGNGITIGPIPITPGEQSSVTIDLNGFELFGGGGIAIRSIGVENVTIRNGTVRDWAGDGISLCGRRNVLEDLKSLSNGGDGITIGDGAQVRRVHSLDNGGDGIASNNDGAGCGGGLGIIQDSYFESNIGDGMDLVGLGSFRAERNRVRYNQGHGISVTNDAVVIGNDLISNNQGGPLGQYGIFVNGVRNRIEGNNVKATDSDVGIMISGDDNTISNNIVAANGFVGIYIQPNSDRNTITSNQVTGNGDGGIVIHGAANDVTGNTLEGNGTTTAASGIYTSIDSRGNLIKENHAVKNGPADAQGSTTQGWGFFIDGMWNSFFNNTAWGHGVCESVPPPNLLNPVNKNYLASATTDMGPVGPANSATSPWANIDGYVDPCLPYYPN